MPAAFQRLPAPAAVVMHTVAAVSTDNLTEPPAENRIIQWNISCASPGQSSFATMLVVEAEAAGAQEFIDTAAGGMHG